MGQLVTQEGDLLLGSENAPQAHSDSNNAPSRTAPGVKGIEICGHNDSLNSRGVDRLRYPIDQCEQLTSVFAADLNRVPLAAAERLNKVRDGQQQPAADDPHPQ